jgi:hypothetical protein
LIGQSGGAWSQVVTSEDPVRSRQVCPGTRLFIIPCITLVFGQRVKCIQGQDKHTRIQALRQAEV